VLLAFPETRGVGCGAQVVVRRSVRRARGGRARRASALQRCCGGAGLTRIGCKTAQEAHEGHEEYHVA